VESKLFQASLLPYLVYSWFLAWTRSAPLPMSSSSSEWSVHRHVGAVYL